MKQINRLAKVVNNPECDKEVARIISDIVFMGHGLARLEVIGSKVVKDKLSDVIAILDKLGIKHSEERKIYTDYKVDFVNVEGKAIHRDITTLRTIFECNGLDSVPADFTKIYKIALQLS